MKYHSNNIFIIYFNDGTYIESNGGADCVKEITVKEELEWVTMEIQKHLIEAEKEMEDVKKIDINLTFWKNK